MVEFQKCGLSHAHILLFLAKEDKNPKSAHIDKIICAEIPDREVGPKYYLVVQDFMVHGPCEISKSNSSCMDDGRCTKYFPKKYVELSTIDEDGYPVYRMRNNGCTIVKSEFSLDNRYVIPHYRYLLIKMEFISTWNGAINLDRISTYSSTLTKIMIV